MAASAKSGDVGIERNPRTELESLARVDAAWGSTIVDGRAIVAAAMTQSSPIGPPPITATSSLASIPSAADGGAVRDRERLDERALCERELLRQRCSQDASRRSTRRRRR